MLKKRILASSLASVMALSSVSVVAFADETATNTNESVSKAQLKDEIANFEAWAEKNLEDYGTTQAEQFEAALERAKVVAGDAKATTEDATAAYQMVKAVKDNMQKYTKEQLEALLADWKSERETDNLIDADIPDVGNWYTTTSWSVFEDAYDEAESYVEYATGRDLTELYVALDEAANGLVSLKQVKKSDYRKALQAYQAVIAKLTDYQPWRRGKCTVAPTTGDAVDTNGDAIDITAATYVTFGELNTIVYGASTGDLEGVNALTSGTYIAEGGAGSVYAFAIAGSEAFDAFQKTNVTTNTTIYAAYEAMVDATNVFNGWVKDKMLESTRASTVKTLNKNYKARMYDTYGKFIKDIVEDDGGSFNSLNGEDLFEWNADKGVLKLKSTLTSEQVAAAGKLALDSSNKIALGTDKKSYKTSDSTDLATVAGTKLAAGLDLTEYFPALTEEMVGTGDLWNVYDLSVKYLAVDDDDYATPAPYATTFGGYTVSGTTDVLDANKVIKAQSGDAKEWTIIYQALRYAYEDTFPDVEEVVTKKTPDVEALIRDCNTLANETGDCSMFKTQYDDVVEATAAAIEWVREAKAFAKKEGKDYTDGTTNVVYAGAGTYATSAIKSNMNSDAVYTALKTAYDALNDEWAKYPVSYGAVAEKIAEVAEAIDDDAYGASTDKVKKAMQDVARRLSTLEASEVGNEVFSYDDVFNKFGRVFTDEDNANADEIALYDSYLALIEAVKTATATPETASGDLNGDGTANAKDALAILKGNAEGKTWTSAEIAIGDIDGDGAITAKDALAILKANVNG